MSSDILDVFHARMGRMIFWRLYYMIDYRKEEKMEKEQMITLKHIVKRFHIGKPNELEILHGISLNVKKGEFVSIVGASGSGKSTFMNIIGILDRPTQGTYMLDGIDVTKARDMELSHIRNHKIGFAFQTYNLIARTSALKNVELPMLYAGVKRIERIKQAKELLQLVEMEERADHTPDELSGGQKQRIAIARALSNKPSILLADEPTGALDSVTGRKIMDLFHMLHKKQGITIILITHSNELAKETERVITLKDGVIIGVYTASTPQLQEYGGKNYECYIPLTTAFRQSRKEPEYNSFDVILHSGVESSEASQRISDYLNNTFYAKNENVRVEAYSEKAMAQEMNNMMNSIKMAIAGIAAIPLLVGGIGVMNIMIVSITERTREIGTRKALGATNLSIRIQFIMEAIVICVIGGMLGVLSGIGIGASVAKIMRYTGTVSIKVILFCVLFSAFFGIFFGYYPANKAAKLDPIKALRYEEIFINNMKKVYSQKEQNTFCQYLCPPFLLHPPFHSLSAIG